jgi:hypothetical protein
MTGLVKSEIKNNTFRKILSTMPTETKLTFTLIKDDVLQMQLFMASLSEQVKKTCRVVHMGIEWDVIGMPLIRFC